ncbi:DUF1295 domain-containing protein [Cryobacterium sp. PAMC25264]|uniref:DUF1295 domain-containing protein n=1 Tax=Cryobacterium sp. PAMC25264 TaxID=2861288 RepID=UPI001C631840|nr:DUF1295 domain-containing protein [Cryobacterium sp. PAMC25264]QYF74697.1 DUF1295 domain-containing protein [Cryobacterium sp. PAMC25264]
MTEPAASALLICLVIAGLASAAAWLLSLATRDYSWADRAWSILPAVYLWIFALAADPPDARLLVLAALGTLWGVRLTLNFARKGGYRPGGEDYRWAELRRRMSPRRFAVVNLVFISVTQNLLLLMIALPGWIVLQHPGRFGVPELAATALFLAFLAGESVADQQQWRFQQKRRRLQAEGAADPGFLRSGLFRFSRHPNYFFEIAQWWTVAVFGALAAGTLLQPGTLGAVLLTLLFVGSIALTESISLARHPGYAGYRREVWPLVPWFPRRHADIRVPGAEDPFRPGAP